VRGDNEQARARLRDETWASITKPSNRYQPLESAAPIAAKSRPTCEVSALQTFSRTIIRVARLSTLNAFISSRRARTSRNGRSLSPTPAPARVLARERRPGEIGVARQIGGRHLGNVTSSKVFATRIRRVVGRLLRVEIVWQTGITRRGQAPRGSCRLAGRIRETQTRPPPASRAVMLAAGELPGGERQIVRQALVQVTEAIRQGRPRRRRDMYEIRSRFLCRPFATGRFR